MFYDETFVNALEHALPPTAGWGLGNFHINLRYRQNCHAFDRSNENPRSSFVPSHEAIGRHYQRKETRKNLKLTDLSLTHYYSQ